MPARGGIVGLLVLGGFLAWLVMSPRQGEPTRREQPSTVPSIVAASQTRLASSQPRATRALPAFQAVAQCVDQQLQIEHADHQQRSCLSGTQVVQNGNVRTYRVQSQGSAGVSTAEVEAAGEQILRAQVTLAAGAVFACGAGQCPGISFGPYDAQGARSIRFERARLWPAAVAVDGHESLLVTGALRTIPDDQLSSSSCVGDVLLVSRGAGTLHFCPDSGSGYDLEEDGGRTFRFTNHDGTTLAVSVSASGALERVAFGAHECRAPGCGGVSVGAADAAGRRRFAFAGTSLLETGSHSAVTVLNGVVVLAPL